MLKKTISVCCFISLIISAFAQNIKINNSVTSAHQRVEGTKLYMIPPTGFVQATEILGFHEENSGNTILVRESAGSYKSLVQTFMTENMTVKGIKVKSQEKIMLNGDEATFFTLEQKVHRTTFTKLLLFFGDSDYATLVSAVFPKGDTKHGEAARKAILSAAYREENLAVPMPNGFRITFKDSGLQWARSISGAVIYTANGSTSSNAIVDNSFFAGSNSTKETNYAAFAKERLQKQIKTELKIESEKEVTIGGLKGYEIKANTLMPAQTLTPPPNNKKAKPISIPEKSRSLYQVLLFQGETYYILFGSATENQATQIALFERLAKSFELER
jgi:hypothetical protein